MMKKKKSYNYGKCHICGEQMEAKTINQDFWIKGNLLVIEDVPAGVCPQCGEKIVNAEVGQQIAAILPTAFRQPQTRTIKVPVISYRQKVA